MFILTTRPYSALTKISVYGRGQITSVTNSLTRVRIRLQTTILPLAPRMPLLSLICHSCPSCPYNVPLVSNLSLLLRACLSLKRTKLSTKFLKSDFGPINTHTDVFLWILLLEWHFSLGSQIKMYFSLVVQLRRTANGRRQLVVDTAAEHTVANKKWKSQMIFWMAGYLKVETQGRG